jgi:hypothetical protein
MPLRLHDLNPGPLTRDQADEVNRWLDELRRLANIVPGPPVMLDEHADGPHLTANLPRVLKPSAPNRSASSDLQVDHGMMWNSSSGGGVVRRAIGGRRLVEDDERTLHRVRRPLWRLVHRTPRTAWSTKWKNLCVKILTGTGGSAGLQFYVPVPLQDVDSYFNVVNLEPVPVVKFGAETNTFQLGLRQSSDSYGVTGTVTLTRQYFDEHGVEQLDQSFAFLTAQQGAQPPSLIPYSEADPFIILSGTMPDPYRNYDVPPDPLPPPFPVGEFQVQVATCKACVPPGDITQLNATIVANGSKYDGMVLAMKWKSFLNSNSPPDQLGCPESAFDLTQFLWGWECGGDDAQLSLGIFTYLFLYKADNVNSCNDVRLWSENSTDGKCQGGVATKGLVPVKCTCSPIFFKFAWRTPDGVNGYLVVTA